MSTVTRWLKDGDVSPMDARYAANVATTGFVVLNFLIVFFGGRLIKRQGQRALLKRKQVPVPITHMTPWLSIGDLFTYVWTLRALPGGFFALCMLIVGTFSTSSRYIINSYITQEHRQDHCRFEDGLISNRIQGRFFPAATWPAATLALAAQDIALSNKGVVGVYAKVPNDVAWFSPQPNELLGKWECTKSLDSVIKPSDWMNRTAVHDFLDRQNFLYRNSTAFHGVRYNDSTYSDFMAWSADLPRGVDGVWNVRASFWTPEDRETARNVSNFQCSLNRLNQAWEPVSMDSNSTLENWDQTMLGAILEIPDTSMGTQLEKMLNAMTMTAGSGNQHFYRTDGSSSNPMQNSTVLSPPQTDTYGCYPLKTVIYNAIFVVTLALILLLLIIVIVDVYDFLHIRFSHDYEVIRDLPFDLLDWQWKLIKRMTGNEGISKRDMTMYEFYWSDHAYHCRIAQGKGTTQIYSPLENPGANESRTSIIKGHGIELRSREV